MCSVSVIVSTSEEVRRAAIKQAREVESVRQILFQWLRIHGRDLWLRSLLHLNLSSHWPTCTPLLSFLFNTPKMTLSSNDQQCGCQRRNQSFSANRNVSLLDLYLVSTWRSVCGETNTWHVMSGGMARRYYPGEGHMLERNGIQPSFNSEEQDKA